MSMCEISSAQALVGDTVDHATLGGDSSECYWWARGSWTLAVYSAFSGGNAFRD